MNFGEEHSLIIVDYCSYGSNVTTHHCLHYCRQLSIHSCQNTHHILFTLRRCFICYERSSAEFSLQGKGKGDKWRIEFLMALAQSVVSYFHHSPLTMSIKALFSRSSSAGIVRILTHSVILSFHSDTVISSFFLTDRMHFSTKLNWEENLEEVAHWNVFFLFVQFFLTIFGGLHT